MSSAREARERQARLRTPSPATTPPAQQDPRSFRASAGIIPVVIRSTEAEMLALATTEQFWVQQIRYADVPPVIGQYEGVGPQRKGMPGYGLRHANLAVYAWGPDDPIILGMVGFWASDDRGTLVLFKPLAPSGTILAVDDPISGCNFG